MCQVLISEISIFMREVKETQEKMLWNGLALTTDGKVEIPFKLSLKWKLFNR